MYADRNFKTKREFKQAVAAGRKIMLWSPGVMSPQSDGTEFVEGPWSPAPHTWYAKVQVHNNVVVKVE